MNYTVSFGYTFACTLAQCTGMMHCKAVNLFTPSYRCGQKPVFMEQCTWNHQQSIVPLYTGAVYIWIGDHSARMNHPDGGGRTVCSVINYKSTRCFRMRVDPVSKWKGVST